MRELFLLTLLATCAGPVPARAAATPLDTTVVEYTLVVPPSAFETGCFGSCACPVASQPTYGSFLLAPAGVGPLYAEYDVRNYIASFNNGPGAVALVGSGHYRIGGEVARMQQLTLDVSLWGGPPLHFDSGLVPVSAAFPALDVVAALHGFACLDTVLRMSAKPISTAGVPPAAGGPIRALWPNPFRSSVRVLLDPVLAGTARIEVLDLAGRSVRTLGRARADAGGTLVWDGLRDDGSPARPGVYWLRARWPGVIATRSAVKLE